MTTTPESAPPELIAIVGMSCRFPGAGTVEQFWQNLRDGVESVRFLTDDELDRAAIDPAELADPAYVRARATLDGIELFDAAFFDFSPREADITDPQQRVFLECAWQALEHAGHAPGTFSGPVGVFAGAGANGYLLYNLASTGHLIGTLNSFQAIGHNKNDHLATRVAYKLDLRGSAITVQTACSTSLVAAALACQSLLSHECDMALAGGVTITVPQKVGYLYTERGIGSPDGHCRAFDARAQGTVGGSGAGVVVLKRLEDAVADGDTIYAVIRGCALNNDGLNKIGYTAPSIDGQAEVIAMAQSLAGVDPGSITYVEAHGTGTPLGDPIEVKALTQAFRRGTQNTQFCALGSVKTNVGHLDTAAGVAGLIKTVLALHHGQIPPSLHFERPNPEIDFAGSPFFINAELRPWPAGPEPRRAGVSSFGVGGTNAHMVLEEAPPRAAGGPSAPYKLLVLSARSDAALETMTTRLAEHLQAHPELDLADVAYTLYTGRKVFDHRRVVVCRDTADAAAALTSLVPDRVFTRTQQQVHRPLCFMFPGQGSQYPGMGAELYRTYAVFREHADRCMDALRRRHDLDLRPLILGAAHDDAEAAARLEQTAVTQPALFVVEYALAQLVMSWGLLPASMIGHSVGEYVAACLAGVFSLDDALDLTALRGRLMQRLPPGAMLTVQLPEREVASLLGPALEIAAANGPASCVVAGPIEAVEALERTLADREVSCRRLRTSHAFHSAMMEPAVAPFREAVARVARKPPAIPFVSNVTGTWIQAEQAQDPDYWAAHLRQTVRFAAGLDVLLTEPELALLEVGPGRALRTIARWHPRKKAEQVMLPCLPEPNETTPELELLLVTVGQLWLAGASAGALFAGEHRRRVPLPTYPFERRPHWVAPAAGALSQGAQGRSLDKRADLTRWFYAPVWKESLASAIELTGDDRARASAAPWLVLADAGALGTRLGARLRAAGCDVVDARPGTSFGRLDGHTYELNPARREDYAALLSELRAARRFPARIVHLMSISAGAVAPIDALDASFFSLLYVAQALGGHPLDHAVELMVVTDGMQEVLGGDLLHPEQAAVLGPCLVIPRELPDIATRSIDLALPAGGVAPDRALDCLIREVCRPSAEAQVAYRGGRRWVQRFEELPLPETAQAAAPYRPDGVYLISGGFGGLGQTFAEHLARRGPARLVLVSRTELPPRSAWPRLIESGADELRARRIRVIQRLEELGAEVLPCRADVTSAAEMRAAVAAAKERFGAVHGVIHAAGVPGGGLVQTKTAQAAAAILAPKITGTQVLASVLDGEPLDFFVACSSLTTVVGRLGQVDYTTANAVMDALVRAYQARTGALAVSINWGAWDEVGMAARRVAAAETTGERLDHPLLQRCLADSPERMVFTTSFSVATQWVVDEHRIVGNPAVPGVTYFEMVRAALARHAPDRTIELRDVFFLAPLRVPEDEHREVRLILERDGDDYQWFVRTTSQSGGKPTDHAVGRARIGGPRSPRVVDLDAIRRRCDRPDAISFEVEHEEDLGPRWRSVQSARLGHGELLLGLEMPPAFATDFSALKLHPALLDRASGMAKGALGERGYYLPLGYGALRIHGDVPARVFSHAHHRTAEGTDAETLAFDFMLIDEHGRVLVEAERMTQKRVHDPGAEIRAAVAAANQAQAPASETLEKTREEITPAEGVAALDRILGARVSPRIVVSVRDLQATIEHSDDVVRDRIVDRILDATLESPSEASSVRSPRPNLKTAFVAPRTEREHQIAAAWQEVLGIDRIGVNDNFFDLGGDSVQAIQIMSKGNKLGLKLSPQQFFQYSTVAELAEVLGGSSDASAPARGALALTPDQRRLIEWHGKQLADAARVWLWEARARLDAAAVQAGLTALAARHEALRLRFLRGDAGWEQSVAAPGAPVPLAHLAVASTSGTERAKAIAAAADELRARLDPTAGQVLAATLIDGGPDQGSAVVLAGHALVADGPAWGLLLEELELALRQGPGALAPVAGAVGFPQWAERLDREVAAPADDALEASYWLAQPWQDVALLPTARTGAAALTGPVSSSSLSADETQSLEERLAGTYRVGWVEALVAAVGQAISDWSGRAVILIDVAGDGRDAIPGLDASRIVGCLELTYPVILDLREISGQAAVLQAVKETMRRVPGRGRSYGFLRQRHGAVQSLPAAEVAVRHLGRFEGGAALVPAGEPSVPGVPGVPLPGERWALGGHRLVIESAVIAGRLAVRCAYDSQAFAGPAIQRLLGKITAALGALRATSPDTPIGLSPSDFPLTTLDQAQLEALAGLIEQADQEAGTEASTEAGTEASTEAGTEASTEAGTNAGGSLVARGGRAAEPEPVAASGSGDGARQIPLVPNQHWYLDNFDPANHVWVTVLAFDVLAAIDPQHVRGALGAIMRHHEALRLRLRRTDRGWGMVVIPDDGEVPFETVDLGSVSPEGREARFREHVIAYHHKPSILTGPTIAMGLFRMGPDQPMRLLFAIHHSVEDNYSLYILFSGFQRALWDIARGVPVSPLDSGPSYSEWARYVMRFAESPAMQAETAYWLDDRRLRAYPLRTDRPRGKHYFGDSRWVRRQLSREETGVLHGLAARHRGSGMSTVVLAAFARAYVVWADQPCLRVDIEHHGRSSLVPGLDLSQTLGGLTTKYPLVVPVDLGKTASHNFDRTRALLDEVPSFGIGYGLLRYCSEDQAIAAKLRAVPPPDILFNFLGNISTTQVASELFRPRPLQPYSNPQDLVSYLLLLSGRVEDGRLELDWMYSSALHDRDAIERLADSTLAELRLLAQAVPAH